MKRQVIHDLIPVLPKAELHVHIEGTLEAELMFEMAERNRLEIPFPGRGGGKRRLSVHRPPVVP